MVIAMNNRLTEEKLKGNWNVIVEDYPEWDFHLEIPNENLSLKEGGKLTGRLVVNGETVEVKIWDEMGIVQGNISGNNIGEMKIVLTRVR